MRSEIVMWLKTATPEQQAQYAKLAEEIGVDQAYIQLSKDIYNLAGSNELKTNPQFAEAMKTQGASQMNGTPVENSGIPSPTQTQVPYNPAPVQSGTPQLPQDQGGGSNFGQSMQAFGQRAGQFLGAQVGRNTPEGEQRVKDEAARQLGFISWEDFLAGKSRK